MTLEMRLRDWDTKKYENLREFLMVFIMGDRFMASNQPNRANNPNKNQWINAKLKTILQCCIQNTKTTSSEHFRVSFIYILYNWFFVIFRVFVVFSLSLSLSLSCWWIWHSLMDSGSAIPFDDIEYFITEYAIFRFSQLENNRFWAPYIDASDIDWVP